MSYILGLVMVSLMLATPGWAGIDEGRVAYFRGDYAAALREILPLAQQGNATAQSFLGEMYSHGQGVPQDYAQAAHWYRQAATQGDPVSQNNLGVMYSHGYGVPRG
jgi:TPR repeat protein